MNPLLLIKPAICAAIPQCQKNDYTCLMKKILAFETSCDDTAVAVVAGDGTILSEAVYSQLEHHLPYGGVVPEIGSRAHIEQISVVTKEVLRRANIFPHEIDIVAATFAPGLLGPLLVGAQFAKGFALSHNKPLIAVHHIAGHVLSGLGEAGFCAPPFVALVVSGGHTALYDCNQDYAMTCIGETLDDAAGEAFDKLGRALGLPYPAGKQIDELAHEGQPGKFIFPRPLRHCDSLNFSFSGLKTHGLSEIRKHAPIDAQTVADFCRGLCDSIAEVLCDRALQAIKRTGHQSLVVGGGVAANSFLRTRLQAMCLANNIKLFLPAVKHCTDNAVMIARAAIIKLKQERFCSMDLEVVAHLPIERAGEL